MGKLIGFLIGFLFVPQFGLYAAFLGLLIGAFYDFRAKHSSSFYSQGMIHDIFAEAFTIFAAAVTKAGGVERASVLAVKNIAVQVFTKQKAFSIMANFKNFVENGIPQDILDQACENILYNYDYQSKMYILTILSAIINAKGSSGSNEVKTLKYIILSIGVYEEDFNRVFYSYRNDNQRNYGFNQSSVHEIDPYSVLEIDKNAGDEEIKKKYRTLCKKFHPDVTSDLSEDKRKESEVKMKEIINAYEKIKKIRGIK